MQDLVRFFDTNMSRFRAWKALCGNGQVMQDFVYEEYLHSMLLTHSSGPKSAKKLMSSISLNAVVRTLACGTTCQPSAMSGCNHAGNCCHDNAAQGYGDERAPAQLRCPSIFYFQEHGRCNFDGADREGTLIAVDDHVPPLPRGAWHLPCGDLVLYLGWIPGAACGTPCPSLPCPRCAWPCPPLPSPPSTLCLSACL